MSAAVEEMFMNGRVDGDEFDDDLFAQVDSAIASVDDLEAAIDGRTDRHGTLVGLCAKLHAIIVGRAAAELLDDTDSLPEHGAVFVAPSWSWLFSRINVGRKDRAADGSRLRLPVRVEWSTSPVSVLGVGRRKRHNWVSTGLGHTGSGSVLVGVSETVCDDRVELDPETGMVVDAILALRSKPEVIAELRRLVEAGQKARWETLLWLEPHVERALILAHSNVANELSNQWGYRRTLLDETKLKSIADQMLLGDESHPGKVSQLLERCLRPDVFKRVDPIKYIKEALRVDANTEIRRALGDPHIGTKIRKVAIELGTAELDEVIKVYRQRYPNDRLSRDRAEAAMSVAPDAMATWTALNAGSE